MGRAPLPHQDIPEANQRLARRMRRALTPAELKLWGSLRNRGLAGLRFRRQAPVGPYIVDFFCPERKLVIEVDGGGHGHFNRMKVDASRDQWLRARGHAVLRFPNAEVLSNLDGVCAAILSAAGERWT